MTEDETRYWAARISEDRQRWHPPLSNEDRQRAIKRMVSEYGAEVVKGDAYVWEIMSRVKG